MRLKPFKIVYPEGSKQQMYHRVDEGDEQNYELVKENEISQILSENLLHVEIMLQQETIMEAFFILKRMLNLIETYEQSGGKLA